MTTRARRLALAAALSLTALAWLACAAVPARADTPGATISPASPRIELLGRWNRSATADTTVNSGSRLFMRFTGSTVVALFDTSSITNPPEFYARIDSGLPRLHVMDRSAVVLGRRLSSGPHLLEIDVKDVDERANRWVPPLQSAFILTGFQLDPGAQALPPPPVPARTILFLGDSITQGVRAVGPQIGPDGADATRDYAWLAGHALNTNFQQVGFGAQGITHGGNGNVPAAAGSLLFNYQGSPIDPGFVPQAVVVNQGTNDGAASSQVFLPAYRSFLQDIRSRWPLAWIFAMRPFAGTHAGDIAAAVAALHDPRVIYVDTTGWLATDEFTDGLHPTVAGHINVARRLERIVASRLGWTVMVPPPSHTRLLAAGSAPGFESGTESGWRAGAYVTGLGVYSAAPAHGAPPYDGRYALQATSAVGPLNEWRTIKLVSARPLTISNARDLFAYVSPGVPAATTGSYDARLTVTGSGGRRESTTVNIPNLLGFLPWDRIHVNLGGWGGHSTITAITISVRGEGSSPAQALPFEVDDIGYTDQADG